MGIKGLRHSDRRNLNERSLPSSPESIQAARILYSNPDFKRLMMEGPELNAQEQKFFIDKAKLYVPEKRGKQGDYIFGTGLSWEE